MANESIINLTQDNFSSEVEQADKTVLVDFWAEWCGPCKMIAPVLDEIADEKADLVKICKVDVDANPALAQQFSVQAIPTLLIFKGGQVVSQIVGMTSKADLIAKLEAA